MPRVVSVGLRRCGLVKIIQQMFGSWNRFDQTWNNRLVAAKSWTRNMYRIYPPKITEFTPQNFAVRDTIICTTLVIIAANKGWWPQKSN